MDYEEYCRYGIGYDQEGRTGQEAVNAFYSSDPPSLDANPPWEGEFENLEVINHLLGDE